MAHPRAGTVDEGTTLTSHIHAALQRRGADEVMFALLDPPPRSSVAALSSSGPVNSTAEFITKRSWFYFVSFLWQRCSDDSSCTPSQSAPASLAKSRPIDPAVCDVGIYCNETYYACVTESACLYLGLSFCVFRPDDAPLRLARLEERRRPRHKLHLKDITTLLNAAVKASHGEEQAQLREGPPLPGHLPHPIGLPSLLGECSDARTAYYMHTSGSTGDPKCVVASRKNLHAYLVNFVRHPDGLAIAEESPSCRIFCLSSPFFDPSIGDMLATLCTPHATFYTCRQEKLLDGGVGALMATACPTHVVSTPAVWGTVSAADVCAVHDSGNAAQMRVFLGGERMSQAIISTWAHRVALFNIYGVTEVTIYQSVHRVLPGSRVSEVTCGTGVGTRITIDAGHNASDEPVANDDETETCGEGYGEVVMYGDQVCVGYADDDDDDDRAVGTARTPFGVDEITGIRFFRTGDIGALVPSVDCVEGRPQLVLRGRRDWQIKLNGQRVSMEEVEGTVQRALATLFSQCACFCVKDAPEPATAPSSAPLIAAAIVFADAPSPALVEMHAPAITEALQEVLAFHLPAFMIPRRWLVYAQGSRLPQTATGKVNRTALAHMVHEQTQQEAAAAAWNAPDAPDAVMRDELYNTVQSMWELHLGLSVHPHTHYLHAGGDSLGALKLTRAIYLRLGEGGDDGIDERGGLPHPFQPCVLLQHPRLLDYVDVLRRELRNNEVLSTKNTRGITADENGADRDEKDGEDTVGTVNSAAPLESRSAAVASTSAASSRMASVFAEVVAAQCCGLAEHLLTHAAVDVNGGNTRDHRCVTPLHIAVSSYDDSTNNAAEESVVRVVDLLLRHGAKPTAVTPDGVTPAHLAAAAPFTVVLRHLLDAAPALVHCRDGRQQSLLHFAARSGRVPAVRLLLSTYQLALDTRDKWQRTPVHWAVLNGHVAVLEAMYAHYASAEVGDDAEGTTTTASGGGNGGLKRSRRCGAATARFTRLARKKDVLGVRDAAGNCAAHVSRFRAGDGALQCAVSRRRRRGVSVAVAWKVHLC